jgi:arylformamidase
MTSANALTEPRYFGYTQSELDSLYDTSRHGADVGAYLQDFEHTSEKVRREAPALLDVPYGTHPRERLDVFPSASADAPVLLFFHGGYWRASNKERYSYIAQGVVPLGLTLVVVEYALLPGVTMSQLLDQCKRAVAFVHRRGSKWGCDPMRMYLSGHSAGGHIVADLMATAWQQDFAMPAEAIRGGLALSGLFDLEPIQHSYLNETLQLSSEDVRQHSPVRLPPTVAAPLHLSVGSDEGAEFVRQASVMRAQWESRNAQIDLTVHPGHNHYSLVASLGDSSSAVCQVLSSWMEKP